MDIGDYVFDSSCAAGSHREMLDADHLRQWTVSWMKDRPALLQEHDLGWDCDGAHSAEGPLRAWTSSDYFGDNGHPGMRKRQGRRGDHRGIWNPGTGKPGTGDPTGEWADTAAVRSLATAVHLNSPVDSPRRIVCYYQAPAGAAMPIRFGIAGDWGPSGVIEPLVAGHETEDFSNFVPRDDDIAVLYSGQHYDALEITIPAGMHEAFGAAACGRG